MRHRYLIFALVFSSLAFGKVAPSFYGELMGGGRVSLKQYLKPDRGLLLCFWASWCGPCLQELANVSEKLKKDPSLPLDVLAVNVDSSETTADIKPTLRLHKLSFPVILDPTHEIFSKYHADKTLPFSVLLGPDGNIETTFNGFHDGMFEKVLEVLKVKVASGKGGNATP
jgi:peroxiredoxin